MFAKRISALAVGLALGKLVVSSFPAQAHDITDAEAAAALAAFAANLEKSSIVGEPDIVDCTLSGGTKTKCFRVTMTPTPVRYTPGPWCPRNITDGPDKSGIWLDKGKVYDADGAFVKNLSTFYNDPRWQLYDPATGKVNVTDTRASCAGAARPDVDPKFRNHCVECLTSYLNPQPALTFVIPAHPVKAAKTTPLSQFTGAGLAFNGVRFDAPAPVKDILDAHTLAPFDDCGGHVNLHVGYHYHAVTGCTKEVPQPDGHAPLIGIATDGFGIHTRLNADGSEPKGLDACGGHDAPGIGYHYHAAEPGANQIIGCFSGEHGCALRSRDQTCDASRPPRRPPPG